MPPSTCNQIIIIKALYIKTDEVIFIYKQMDVLLWQITGVLQGQQMTAFRIAAICWEVNVVVDQAIADNAHELVDSKHSTLYKQNTSSGPWCAQLQHGPYRP